MTILEIQTALKAAGFDPGALDGKDGPHTQAAVKAYQQAHGLAVDGIAGPRTQESLRGGGAGSAAPAPAAITTPSPTQTYQDKYPQFSWAFRDPEVVKILSDAMQPQNLWGPDEVQARIQQTNWWKTKTNAERDWLQTLSTDPADASRQMWNYDSITKYVGLANDYGIPMTFDTAQQQVARVVNGSSTGDALTEELRRQAKAMYPQLSQQIDAGSTVTDIYAPYKQLATSVLGVNPASVSLSDPKWQQPLQYHAKDGQVRLATTDEWMTQLRTDPRFGYDHTTNGRSEAAQLTSQISQIFGTMS